VKGCAALSITPAKGVGIRANAKKSSAVHRVPHIGRELFLIQITRRKLREAIRKAGQIRDNNHKTLIGIHLHTYALWRSVRYRTYGGRCAQVPEAGARNWASNISASMFPCHLKPRRPKRANTCAGDGERNHPDRAEPWAIDVCCYLPEATSFSGTNCAPFSIARILLLQSVKALRRSAI